ncbi:MAG: MBL fold metallo-hydrolase [Pseudobutyrivibrio sp.]|nr:MBL fold metallo-hydrolase [Pseudobutyrivibrio sp.]
MKVKRVFLPVCAMNCYLAINDKTKECIVIDPGSAAERIFAAIEEEQVTPVAILLTHGHFDHVGALEETAEKYHIQVYAHEKEQVTLETPEINLSGDMIFKPTKYKADIYLKDEQELDLAGFHLRCLFTPGHTPGGCCYYFKDEGILFTGDTLFCGSVGRTDFPGGSMSQLVNGIREKLMVLPEDTICYPGHESATTIGDEKMYNPYL